MNLDEIREIENISRFLRLTSKGSNRLVLPFFQLSMTQDKLRGFSIVDEANPVIGIKRGGESPTGKIFTLFHELGHIFLNEGGLCDLSENTKLKLKNGAMRFRQKY